MNLSDKVRSKSFTQPDDENGYLVDYKGLADKVEEMEKELEQQNERLHQLNMRVDDERSKMKREPAEAHQERDNWIDTAKQHNRNEDYYRGLVVECGETIGEQSYIADDGGKHIDVLCAKVPELVAALKAENDSLRKSIQQYLDCQTSNMWVDHFRKAMKGGSDE